MDPKLVEVGVGIGMVLLASIFNYRYRYHKFRVPPFVRQEGYRVTKPICAYEHLTVGLLLVPLLDVSMRIYRMTYEPPAAIERSRFWALWICIAFSTVVYMGTVSASVFIDALDLVSAQKSRGEPVMHSYNYKSPTLVRYFTLYITSIAVFLASVSILWVYSPHYQSQVNSYIKMIVGNQ
jgi:hypothetical protein